MCYHFASKYIIKADNILFKQNRNFQPDDSVIPNGT